MVLKIKRDTMGRLFAGEKTPEFPCRFSGLKKYSAVLVYGVIIPQFPLSSPLAKMTVGPLPPKPLTLPMWGRSRAVLGE